MNSPRGTLRAARLQRRDRVGNREDVLERRVPPGPVADQHDVVVRVDDAGDDRSSPEVDDRGRCPASTTLLPTAAKRPLRISTCETTRLAGSIVWIRPLMRPRSRSTAGAGVLRVQVEADERASAMAAAAPPMNCLRERPPRRYVIAEPYCNV